jgi:hypothetical protein
MATNDDDETKELTEEQQRRMDAEAKKLGAFLTSIQNLRRLIGIALQDVIWLDVRVQYELTENQVAQKIKRKELPKLRLAIDSLSTLVEKLEKAIDAKIERLVE